MTRRDDGLPADDRIALDALSVFSKKWHPVVVLTLSRYGPLGFNDLLEELPEISSKVLSDTLDGVRDVGLVERRVVSDSPLRVEYELTDAGADVIPIFDSLGDWGTRHLESESPTVLLADSDRRLAELYGDWLADRYSVVRAHTGDELERSLDEGVDVVFVDDGLPGVDLEATLNVVGSLSRTILVVGDRPAVELLERSCDDVLQKPVVRETILEAVETQLRRQGESADQRARAALAAKLSFLESVYPRERLATSDTYRRGRDRLAEFEA
ncbi:winged helix-turn-helix transcriptional regulator [Natronolimnohabitans innermongolicus]|nr:winged helix-turn-helix transcriptional regulator [Natronolimnohabitans innermongolicus]